MNENLMNINKTKYRYFMDNIDLSTKRTAIKYTIPVDKEPLPDSEYFNRDYPVVDISNKKLVEMIDKTAKALLAIGVKKETVVTICQTNTPEILYMDYSLSKIGAIANYIYPNVTAEEMRYYLDELDSKYMFILDDAPIKANVKKAVNGRDIKIISSSVIESFPKLFKLIASKKAPANTEKLENEIKWEDFIKQGKRVKCVDEAPYVPKATCSYVHTSGTSKTPKAVIETNENVNCVTKNYEIDGFHHEAGKIGLQTIPQFVEYGKTTNHLYLCNGVCIVIIPEMNPKNYYDLISKFKPEYGFATPSHARELIKRPTDMSNTICLGFGGDGFDDVEEKLNKYLKENGASDCAFQGYGSTETSAVAITNLPNSHKIGSIGKPFGETKAIIVEPDTFNIINEPNKVGELCLTGPGVTNGYAGNSKEETEQVYVKHPDGLTYVHMGDYVSVDEEGFYFYHGRIKNVIARKSFKFSPKEIEDAILSHSKVAQCVVVGKYDKEEGQVPSAHIVLTDDTDREKTLNEIITIVNDNVQEFHRPTVYKIKSEIIKTRNNKININALKIEDIATIPPGISDAEITLSDDENFDYELKLFTATENTDKEKIIAFIDSIAKNEKVLNGKIRYSFVNEKSKTYIKEIK